MPRVKMIQSKSDVPKGGEAAWDAITESRGRVVGPFQVLLHSPELAKRIAATGAYARFEGGLPQDMREIAILTVAREMNSLFEWGAVSERGRMVEPLVLDQLRGVACPLALFARS